MASVVQLKKVCQTVIELAQLLKVTSLYNQNKQLYISITCYAYEECSLNNATPPVSFRISK